MSDLFGNPEVLFSRFTACVVVEVIVTSMKNQDLVVNKTESRC